MAGPACVELTSPEVPRLSSAVLVSQVYLKGRSGDRMAHEKSISQLKSEVQYIQEVGASPSAGAPSFRLPAFVGSGLLPPAPVIPRVPPCPLESDTASDPPVTQPIHSATNVYHVPGALGAHYPSHPL